MQKRSKKKDLYPGVWDMSVGGHNKPGDTYEESARREMKEELGLKIPLRKIGKMLLRYGKTETEFDMIFETILKDQKSQFNKNEIDEVKFFSLKEIRKIDNSMLGPKVLRVLNFYKRHR